VWLREDPDFFALCPHDVGIVLGEQMAVTMAARKAVQAESWSVAQSADDEAGLLIVRVIVPSRDGLDVLNVLDGSKMNNLSGGGA